MVCGVALCAGVLLAVVTSADIHFPSSDDDNAEIPLHFRLKLSALENFTEFQDFIDDQSLEKDLPADVVSRFGDSIDRKAATIPKNAVCMPELQVVELVKDKDPSLLYFPTCTRLEQCGGCCSSELLSCQPTSTETINYMVYVTSYANAGKLKVKDKIVIPVEKHLSCRCLCATKKEDCNKLQEYQEDNCQCRCLNTDEEKKCRTENTTKIWDPNNCICSCRQTQQCSTNYIFDHNTCSCSEITTRRRHISDADSRYRRGSTGHPAPLPVLPLHSDSNKQV